MTVAEDASGAANLAVDVNWAREACAFIIFIHNVVRNFVASELLLLASIAALRYVSFSFNSTLCQYRVSQNFTRFV